MLLIQLHVDVKGYYLSACYNGKYLHSSKHFEQTIDALKYVRTFSKYTEDKYL